MKVSIVFRGEEKVFEDYEYAVDYIMDIKMEDPSVEDSEFEVVYHE